MMTKNNLTYVTKKEFNLAMTLIIIMLVVHIIIGWSTTNSIETLYNEVNDSIERDIKNIGISSQNQTEADAALKRDIGIREDLLELQSQVLELQKIIENLQDEKIKDLELETLPQVELKGQYPHPRLHGL